MVNYKDLVTEFRNNPRDVPTNPKNGNAPIWFYAYEDNGSVYISSGRNHSNASSVCPDRKLQQKEFERMLDLHHRRERGEPVYKEAKSSMNQAYWFGIFKELSL